MIGPGAWTWLDSDSPAAVVVDGGSGLGSLTAASGKISPIQPPAAPDGNGWDGTPFRIAVTDRGPAFDYPRGLRVATGRTGHAFEEHQGFRCATCHLDRSIARS